MEILGENLISYEKVMDFLKTKRKGKNFFNTLRTRHKLIHKPIVKSPISFSLKEAGIKFRKGRSVFYLKEIIPYLEDIIRLHDEKQLSYKQIEKEIKSRKHTLDELRKLELADENRLKPGEFIDQFEIAKIKLKNSLGWNEGSKEMQFLDYISEERKRCGMKFYELTKTMRQATQKGEKLDLKNWQIKRENLGRKLDFCHQIMGAIINQFKELLTKGKLKMTAEDWRNVFEKIKKK